MYTTYIYDTALIWIQYWLCTQELLQIELVNTIYCSEEKYGQIENPINNLALL